MFWRDLRRALLACKPGKKQAARKIGILRRDSVRVIWVPWGNNPSATVRDDTTAPPFGETATNLKALRTYNVDTVGGNLNVDGTNNPGGGSLDFDTIYNFDIIANISGSAFNSGGS